MPYYCTVPRCTSMAGKVKNVSFHQFPRDEELAKQWNDILKRGKPYTKYSKVCSLHFLPEDYAITSSGKYKGQWRTLHKDAIPSQNLPSDTPAPNIRRRSWRPLSEPAIDPQLQHQAQQLAHAIYMQTMLAMQAAGVPDPMALNHMSNGLPQPLSTEVPESSLANTSTVPEIDIQPENNEQPDSNQEQQDSNYEQQDSNQEQHRTDYDSNHFENKTSYKCDECSKCFKDPDVYILHKRMHKGDSDVNGKENYDLNTLKSNPILANLLKNTMERDIFNTNLFEKQIMVSFLQSVTNYDGDCDNSDLSDNLDDNNLVIDENVA